MNIKSIPFTLASLALPLLGGMYSEAFAQSQEMARVVSSTPVVTQVSVPRQVCGETQVITSAPKSGAGALMGAIAGGAIGNTIGGGSGRALATAAGVIGGAMFGNSIEAAPPPIARQVTNCTTQMSYENRITAYNVVYDYGGKQYSIQLPNDPGPYLPVQVTPSVLAAPPVTSTTIISPPPLVTRPTYVTSVYTPPIYAAPLYGPPMYPAPGLSFQFGYGHHWHEHDRRRWH